MLVGTIKDQGLYNKPSAAVHPGALAAGTLPQYNTIAWLSDYLSSRGILLEDLVTSSSNNVIMEEAKIETNIVHTFPFHVSPDRYLGCFTTPSLVQRYTTLNEVR